MHRATILLLTFAGVMLTLTIFGCRDDDPTTPAPEPKIGAVIMYGAPWCATCKTEIPMIHAALRAKRITGSLFVVTGKTAGARPTVESAHAYAGELGITAGCEVGFGCQKRDGCGRSVTVDAGGAFCFDVRPDEWRWVTYRGHFGDQMALPAAIVIDEAGRPIRKFGPGHIDQDVIAFLKSQPDGGGEMRPTCSGDHHGRKGMVWQ